MIQRKLNIMERYIMAMRLIKWLTQKQIHESKLNLFTIATAVIVLYNYIP